MLSVLVISPLWLELQTKQGNKRRIRRIRWMGDNITVNVLIFLYLNFCPTLFPPKTLNSSWKRLFPWHCTVTAPPHANNIMRCLWRADSWSRDSRWVIGHLEENTLKGKKVIKMAFIAQYGNFLSFRLFTTLTWNCFNCNSVHFTFYFSLISVYFSNKSIIYGTDARHLL